MDGVFLIKQCLCGHLNLILNEYLWMCGLGIRRSMKGRKRNLKKVNMRQNEEHFLRHKLLYWVQRTHRQTARANLKRSGSLIRKRKRWGGQIRGGGGEKDKRRRAAWRREAIRKNKRLIWGAASWKLRGPTPNSSTIFRVSKNWLTGSWDDDLTFKASVLFPSETSEVFFLSFWINILQLCSESRSAVWNVKWLTWRHCETH